MKAMASSKHKLAVAVAITADTVYSIKIGNVIMEEIYKDPKPKFHREAFIRAAKHE